MVDSTASDGLSKAVQTSSGSAGGVKAAVNPEPVKPGTGTPSTQKPMAEANKTTNLLQNNDQSKTVKTEGPGAGDGGNQPADKHLDQKVAQENKGVENKPQALTSSEKKETQEPELVNETHDTSKVSMVNLDGRQGSRTLKIQSKRSVDDKGQLKLVKDHYLVTYWNGETSEEFELGYGDIQDIRDAMEKIVGSSK